MAASVGLARLWSIGQYALGQRGDILADIAFTTRLTELDWDETLRGWRCPPLAVPGAVVEAIYIEGNRIDSSRYEVLQQHAVVRWVPSEQPPRAVAAIKLTEALTLGAETDRWKKLAIILPVIATILSALIAGGVTVLRDRNDRPPVPPSPPVVGPGPDIPSANPTKRTARELVLGQTVKGDTVDGERWFSSRLLIRTRGRFA